MMKLNNAALHAEFSRHPGDLSDREEHEQVGATFLIRMVTSGGQGHTVWATAMRD